MHLHNYVVSRTPAFTITVSPETSSVWHTHVFPLHFRQEILAFTRGNTCIWFSLKSQLFPDESVKETYMFLQKNVMSTECKFLQPWQQEFYNYNKYNDDDDDNNNNNNHRFVFLKTH